IALTKPKIFKGFFLAQNFRLPFRTAFRTFRLASDFSGEISIPINGLRIAVFDSAERSETGPNLGPVWRRIVGCGGVGAMPSLLSPLVAASPQ
ncbi:MAG: hypothetical protein ACOYMG_26815, partial [Candidatus Methylumidiphilus sp.]